MEAISTPLEAIEALGGTRAVSELLSLPLNTVSNWRRFEKLPAHTYPKLSPALAEKGVNAPASLWNFEPPNMTPRKAKRGAGK